MPDSDATTVGNPATPKRGRPRSANLQERRREQLTRAAFEVFAEVSYDTASVSDVAKRAGMGQGTLYRYVESKRELLDMVVDWCIEQLMEAISLDEFLDDAGSDDITTAQTLVDEIGHRLYTLVDTNPALLRVLTIQAGAVDREIRYRVMGLNDTIVAHVARVLNRAAESGTLTATPDETTVIARILPTLTLPGLVLILGNPGADDEQKDSFVRSAALITRSGIMKKAANR